MLGNCVKDDMEMMSKDEVWAVENSLNLLEWTDRSHQTSE